MKYVIIGKNIDVTAGLRASVEEKIGKLEKYFTPDTEVHVTLSVEKERHKIEVTIPVKGSIIRSEQVSNDMYVSIDLVEEIIERQLKKYKNKIIDKEQAAESFRKEYVEREYQDEDEIQIVRTKQFDMKPMYPEDACVQMELLGHNFYVFRNAETDAVNVVYKRKGNTYGLIEPEV
ncbi:MAG TPA: ribosome-associated translation inhibitor RaiA [Lachnospiraceae bacterium]|nr:ribosome-associated translation inhibitor RaiA [Lachnospiraceae bacterium]